MLPVIRLEEVSVVRDGTAILDAVSVRLDAPRIAVIGGNGSGKSTFARLLNGLVTPTTGIVEVHGHDAVREARVLRERVGFVFSSPDAQVLMPTVAEDVALSLRRLRLEEAERAARVDAQLRAQGLAELADRSVHSLSGGQKQLLALASVLVARPALLVADEPTTLLDLRNARMIGDAILSGDVPQVVVVTHDLELAVRCDVAVLLEGGRVVAVDEPTVVVARYRAGAP